MVLGFGKGKIEVSLDKFNFSPGDTIKGTATLKLKKPIKARKIAVIFAGERTTTRGPLTSSRSSTRTDYVHKFELTLDGEKEYLTGEYPFEIAIPSDVLQRNPKFEGALGTAIKAAQVLGGGFSRTEWYVKAYLDIPKGFDVSKKVQINLTETKPGNI